MLRQDRLQTTGCRSDGVRAGHGVVAAVMSGSIMCEVLPERHVGHSSHPQRRDPVDVEEAATTRISCPAVTLRVK